MTYRPHLLLQFGGRLFDTEEWSCSFRMLLGSPDVTIGPTTGVMNAWARDNIEDMASDLAGWHEDPGTYNSTAARLDYVKCNAIAENGRYADDGNTILFEFGGTDAPQGTGQPGPPQASLCVSLLTGVSRGRASRGRIYPPTGAQNYNGSTGRVTGTATSGLVASTTTLLNNLANMPGPDLLSPRVVVASELGQPGPVRNVTRVAVGDVMDTQRRRRESLPETYTVGPNITIV